MTIRYIGAAPKVPARWLPWTNEPLFEVDALVAFDGMRELTAEEVARLEFAKAHGRPLLYFGKLEHRHLVDSRLACREFKPEAAAAYERAAAAAPRTNYQPIDCNFYDNFEAAIVQRRPVDLTIKQVDGSERRIKTRLLDTRTDRTEEYVKLADGNWVRLDRIAEVDGVAAGASCRF